MKSAFPRQRRHRHAHVNLGLLLMGSIFSVSACSGEDPVPRTPAPITLSSEILATPLSTADTDRFFLHHGSGRRSLLCGWVHHGERGQPDGGRSPSDDR